MNFFLDTAIIEDIKTASQLGIIDGVTTNPSLMAKVGITATNEIALHYQTICEIINGPVSAEVIALDYEGMVAEGTLLAALHPAIVVKLPLTQEGIRACAYFSKIGIKTNVTLVFSVAQAILAAKAGATYVSPFIGRLEDVGADGVGLISGIRTVFNQFCFPTKILAASIRNVNHVTACAKAGADVVTAPLSVYLNMYDHQLTKSGLEQFMKDYESGRKL